MKLTDGKENTSILFTSLFPVLELVYHGVFDKWKDYTWSLMQIFLFYGACTNLLECPVVLYLCLSC